MCHCNFASTLDCTSKTPLKPDWLLKRTLKTLKLIMQKNPSKITLFVSIAISWLCHQTLELKLIDGIIFHGIIYLIFYLTVCSWCFLKAVNEIVGSILYSTIMPRLILWHNKRCSYIHPFVRMLMQLRVEAQQKILHTISALQYWRQKQNISSDFNIAPCRL